jgi:hypothetical protein
VHTPREERTQLPGVAAVTGPSSSGRPPLAIVFVNHSQLAANPKFMWIDCLHLLAFLSLGLVFTSVVSTSKIYFLLYVCPSHAMLVHIFFVGQPNSLCLVNNISVVFGVIQPSRSFCSFSCQFFVDLATHFLI